VLLVEEAQAAVLESASPLTVVDGDGAKLRLPAGRVPLGVRLKVAGRALVSPLTFSPGKAPLVVDGRPYRGQVRVLSNRKRLQVVNVVALEDYLKGVVPAEVPDDWPAEALKAQAVAARSYALASLPPSSSSRTFDLYADVRDQVYGGIAEEAPAVTSAVQATAGQVLVYGGRIVTAYYSSTTGGRTASAVEWLGNPVPYLVSVPDPYDTHSPYHTWGPVLFDARKVGRALGLESRLVDLVATRGDSGRVRELTAVGDGGEVTVRGTDVRTRLGLRSTWFSIGWLALDPPARAAFGAAVELAGTARGIEGAVVLEGRALGGRWQEVARVQPAPDGSFALTVRPKATMEYRLAAAGVRGALVRMPVQPVVKASVVSRLVEGRLSPPLSGAVVEVQRQRGGAWATVARATTRAGGSFAVGKRLAPGSYRVVCEPGKGLVTGVSRMLAVS
jgi:SpoIID/LytB domain protein